MPPQLGQSIQSLDEELSLAAGEQGILYDEPLDCPFKTLPTDAFENLLIVTFRSPRIIEDALKSHGHDIDNVGVIPISSEPQLPPTEIAHTDPANPNDPTDLSIKFTKSLDCLSDGEGWVVFEKCDLLNMYLENDTSRRFMKYMIEEVQNRDHRGVYEVSPGTGATEMIQQIETHTQQSWTEIKPGTHN